MLNREEVMERVQFFENTLHHMLAVDPSVSDFLFDEFSEEGFYNYVFNHGFYDEYEFSEDGIKIASGCFRFALICENDDYVLKLDYDDDYRYCESEAEYYERAIEKEIADCFAECHKVSINIYGRTFTGCIMEKCYCDSDKMSDRASEIQIKESGLSYDKFIEEIDNMDREWVWGEEAAELIMIEEFGEKYRSVFDFMVENKINDVHCGNIGYDMHGKLKVTDYAGI